MILVDANLLVYAYNIDAAQYAAARQWLENALSRDEDVALPWAVIHAFVRLSTAGAAFATPLSIEAALFVVDGWLGMPRVKVLEAGPRYWGILRHLCISSHVRGKLLSDAHLAALALEQDATLCTTDRDFQRFAGLRVLNPIV